VQPSREFVDVVSICDPGWVAEWFKAAVLKTAEGATLPWVRIPPHPDRAKYSVVAFVANYWIFCYLMGAISNLALTVGRPAGQAAQPINSPEAWFN
jgi:hypothetical protein